MQSGGKSAMKRTLTLTAVVLAISASTTGLAAEPDGRTLGVTCAGCHGTDGVSHGAAPSLKGLPAPVIEQSMKDFKDDKRPATIMNRIAKGYTDKEIKRMAEWFASLK
jgi:sulfide dehydrogenase cytochrome subunit